LSFVLAENGCANSRIFSLGSKQMENGAMIPAQGTALWKRRGGFKPPFLVDGQSPVSPETCRPDLPNRRAGVP
jgi:hypothetical protein